MAWRNKQNEFGHIADETKLRFEELEQLGLSAENYKIATAKYINPAPLEYGAAVDAAVNTLTTKLDRTAQAERTAKLNKERAANREKIKAQIEAENNKPKPLLMTFEQQ